MKRFAMALCAVIAFAGCSIWEPEDDSPPAPCTDCNQPDGDVEPTETCGNGTCNADAGENRDNCRTDCWWQCGDGHCDPFEDCEADCASDACGDGTCADNESCSTCEVDCGSCCGNGSCDPNEIHATCPEDCPAEETCGDGTCDPTIDETHESCPVDCPAPPVEFCGDEQCNGDETNESCPEDCPVVCGDEYCNPDSENNENCSDDCEAVCGDGYCNPDDECRSTCPADCPPVCGDSRCETGEDSDSCAADCMPDPFWSPSANVFLFNNLYAEGAATGLVIGDLSAGGWRYGEYIVDEDEGVSDGWLGMSRPDGHYDAGTYRFTYGSLQGAPGYCVFDWSNFGTPDFMRRMRPEALEYVCCNWVNPATGDEYASPDDYVWCDGTPLADHEGAGCALMADIDASGNVTPGANGGMRLWAESFWP